MTPLHSNVAFDGPAYCQYCGEPAGDQRFGERCDGPLPLRKALERIAKAEVVYGDANSLNASQLRQIARAALDSIPEPATGGAAGRAEEAVKELFARDHGAYGGITTTEAVRIILAHAPASPAIPDEQKAQTPAAKWKVGDQLWHPAAMAVDEVLTVVVPAPDARGNIVLITQGEYVVFPPDELMLPSVPLPPAPAPETPAGGAEGEASNG